MAVTSWTNPGTAVEPTFTTWTNVANVLSSDDNDASSSASTTDYIKATNFGFSIPAGATIDGIEAQVEAAQAGNYSDINVYLVVGDTIQTGTTNQKYGTLLGATDSYRLYPSSGGSTDTWGNSLSVSSVNASDFGVAVKYAKVSAGSMTVDNIQMRVYYTESGSSNVEVTPGAITATTSLPNPTISISESLSPDPVTGTVSLPSPTISVGDGASPAQIDIAVSLPVPTISAVKNVEVSPGEIASTASLPAPSTSGNASNDSDVVTALFTGTPPTISMVAAGVDVGVTPGVLTITASAPSPTITGDAVVEPGVVDITVATQAPSIAVGDGATPAPVTASLSLPTPAISTGTTVSIGQVNLTATLPSPTTSYGLSKTADLQTATVTTPEPSVSGSAIVSADVVTMTASTQEVFLTGISVTVYVPTIYVGDRSGPKLIYIDGNLAIRGRGFYGVSI